MVLVGLFSFGCQDEEVEAPGKTELVELGELPAKVKATGEFKSATYKNGKVYVATSDGVWEFDTAASKWARVGFEGKEVELVYAHPEINNLLFVSLNPETGNKAFFRSEDAGKTWTAAETGIFDSLDEKFEIYYDLAVRPNHPDHIYANMSGTTIAVSTDKGKNWKRVNDMQESYFGYQSNLIFLPDSPNKIYQGSENPLDFAWLGEYTINATEPSKLSDYKQLVNIDKWSNRRPVELLTNSNAIYVGQEGAVSKITNGETKYIFKVEQGEIADSQVKFPYAYVYGIWVDPKDPKHLVFGGAINGTQNTLSLFETYDEGQTVAKFDTMLGMTEPFVKKILTTNAGPIIVVADVATDKIKLYKLK